MFAVGYLTVKEARQPELNARSCLLTWLQFQEAAFAINIAAAQYVTFIILDNRPCLSTFLVCP